MTVMRARSLALVLVAALIGCGGGNGGGGDDTLEPDIAADVGDSIPTDTGDADGGHDGLGDDTPGDHTGGDVTTQPGGWAVLDLAPPGAVNGIWGVDGRLFAVGDGGVILWNTGAGWGPMQSPTEYKLFAVFGQAGDDLWAGGQYGTLLHFDGEAWTAVETGLPGLESVDIKGLWGESGHLFAVGTGGVILHLIGDDWSKENSNTDADLLSIWGASLINVFVGTSTGSLLRNVGGAWTSAQVFGGGVKVSGLHGTGMFHVVAAGSGGSIAVFDGESWAPKLSNDPQTRDLHGVWAYDTDNIWLAGAGGVVIHYNGKKWNLADVKGPYYKEKDWEDLWGHVTPGGAAELWSCGDDGAMLLHSAEEWADASSWPQSDIHDLVGHGGGDALAVGDAGFMARWDGDAWTTLESGTDRDLFGAAVAADGAILVAGEDGTLLRVEGAAVTPVETGLSGDLRSVCEGDDGALRVCGVGGLLAVQEGDVFTLIQTGTVQELNDCVCGPDGSLLAVGALGTALLLEGGETTAVAQTVPTAATLRRLDGPDFDDLIAVGDNGVVVRRTGGSWEKIRDESASFLYGVRWDGDIAIAVGWSGTLAIWDGEAWTTEQIPGAGVIEQVWGMTPEALLAVGKKGLFLRYVAPEDES
ncbi:MAG: hypothetical protein ABIK09_09750 [Pseudomonadota bacterium]